MKSITILLLLFLSYLCNAQTNKDIEKIKKDYSSQYNKFDEDAELKKLNQLFLKLFKQTKTLDSLNSALQNTSKEQTIMIKNLESDSRYFRQQRDSLSQVVANYVITNDLGVDNNTQPNVDESTSINTSDDKSTQEKKDKGMSWGFIVLMVLGVLLILLGLLVEDGLSAIIGILMIIFAFMFG